MAKVNYEKAWKTLKEKRIQEYIKLHRTVNQIIGPNKSQRHIFQVANAMVSKKDLAYILGEMDKLDGTKEFSKIRSKRHRNRRSTK